MACSNKYFQLPELSNVLQCLQSNQKFCFYVWSFATLSALFWECFYFLLALVYMFIILRYHGDTEPNPGPRKLKTINFSNCHWNLNSLSAHNFYSFSKLTQLKAYNSIYKYDFICLSETYLDSSILDNLINSCWWSRQHQKRWSLYHLQRVCSCWSY